MITRPWLLKMYISSQLASDDFGLTDEQIFNLIGNHNMEPRIPKEDDHDQLDSGHKIGLIFLLFILILFVNRACAQTAQYDTAIVRYQNIERIGSQTTDKVQFVTTQFTMINKRISRNNDSKVETTIYDTKFYFYRDKDIKIDIAIENVKI